MCSTIRTSHVYGFIRPSAPDNMFAVGVCSAIIKGELYILEDSNNILVPAFRDEQCADDIAVVLLNERPLKSDAHSLSRNVHRVPVPLQPSSLPPKPFTLIDHRCFTLKSTISSKSFLSDLGRNRLKQLFPLPSPPSAATITLCFSPNLPFYRRRSRKLYRCLKQS